MDKPTSQRLIALPIIVLVALGVAWAAGRGGQLAAGWPIVLLCTLAAFLIQWLAFIPAWLQRTEKFYDLVGSLTYLTLLVLTLTLVDQASPRALLLAALIALWAGRLGTFLFRRIHRAGADRRFDEIKQSGVRFFTAWTVQGLWVFLTASAALTAMTSLQQPKMGAVAAIGMAVWLAGFAIEVLADRQKSAFRQRPENRGRFIDSGLWRWSRHPNYFGEIVLWIGIFVIAAPTLQGWQWVTLISPLFVSLLLLKVSGVPLLEAQADRRWGDDPEYQAYKAATPVLFPRPPKA